MLTRHPCDWLLDVALVCAFVVVFSVAILLVVG